MSRISNCKSCRFCDQEGNVRFCVKAGCIVTTDYKCEEWKGKYTLRSLTNKELNHNLACHLKKNGVK